MDSYPNNGLRENVGMICETMPNAGRIRIYTSGWPKNQKICWNMTGSPPPAAMKKLVPKYLSVSNMVTAPASTGMDAISRNAVIIQVHTNSGNCMKPMPGARMLNMVAIMLIAPMMEETPRKCTVKIRNGKPSPSWVIRGGYMVQPPAGAPPSMKKVASSMVKANGSIQKLMLFMRGSAMSGAPIIMGTIQLASPTPAGMITPNIMTSACMVVMALKNCGSTYCIPGWNSSARTTMAMAPPIKNMIRANTRYMVPISLWLVENSQRPRPVGLWS